MHAKAPPEHAHEHSSLCRYIGHAEEPSRVSATLSEVLERTGLTMALADAAIASPIPDGAEVCSSGCASSARIKLQEQGIMSARCCHLAL